MCRSKAVHECDLFIGVVKNEGEDEVSVKLVIENFHAVEVKLDTYKTRERDPKYKPNQRNINSIWGKIRLMSSVIVNSSVDTRTLFLQ